ncbi:hypothetical protein J6590_045384 [Homalodisca vitripennis]|nr:hypothetical protein J6590_045384 [Homalodisca vitripennis]
MAPKLKLNDQELEYSGKAKKLGLIIDKHLRWTEQAFSICIRVFAGVHSLKRLASYLPQQAKIILIKTLLWSFQISSSVLRTFALGSFSISDVMITKSFKVSACRLWNAIPVNIRGIDKRARFGVEIRVLMLGAQGDFIVLTLLLIETFFISFHSTSSYHNLLDKVEALTHQIVVSDGTSIIGVVSSGEGEKKPSTAKSRQSRKATYSGALSNRSFPLHPHPPRATSSSSEASTKLNINLDIQPMSADSRKFHHKRGRHHKRTTESLVQSRQWQVAEESAPVKPPSLSIIDFNSLTRGGLDESMGLTKTRSKSHTKKSHKRKRKTKKPPPVSPETAVVDEVNSPAEVEDTSDSP